MSRAATRELLTRYFPDVLRGEGPESVVFVRDAAGRVIGTMPMQSAERIIAFLRGESDGSWREQGNAEQLEPHHLELRTQGNETRELTARQQEERQQQEQRRAGEPVERGAERAGADSDRENTAVSRYHVTVMYRRGFSEEPELTAEQRHTAERVLSADRVEHGAGDGAPQEVHVVFLTLRRGA